MTTLYKIDSDGRSRVLNISVEGSTIVQASGLIDGKLAEHRSACSAKSAGRSNETTAEGQAVLEAASKVTAKLKEGYYTTLAEAQANHLDSRSSERKLSMDASLLPMLAKDYKKEFKKVKFPCFVQPKLDGMRCLSANGIMKSRSNTAIETMGHILENFAGLDDSVILDGELYAHGLDFQENMRLVKKWRPESVNVKYHVYDMISDAPFSVRYADLAEIVEGMSEVELVPTFVINNEEELKKYHAQFLSEGYEGTIIRWGEMGYEIDKRSSGLLKYKDFLDLALPIKDILPSDVIPSQGFPTFHWPGAKDDTLSAGMRFSHADREEFLRNKQNYIGKTAELRFFEYSDKGVPRFPVCVGFRLDK